MVLGIAGLIHLYDFNYNYEEFHANFFGNTAEFKSNEMIEMESHMHDGHKHIKLPFDLSSV